MVTIEFKLDKEVEEDRKSQAQSEPILRGQVHRRIRAIRRQG